MQVKVSRLDLLDVRDQTHREHALYALNKAVQRQLAEAADFDLIYERHSLFSYAAMEYARHKCIPGILEVNAPLVDEQARYRVLVNRELAERTVRRVMTAAGAVIAVSRAVAEHVRIQRLSHSSIYVVPNGVDLTRFAADRGGELTCGDFVVGFVGTLKPWHGVSTLIQAFPAVLERSAVRNPTDCRRRSGTAGA